MQVSIHTRTHLIGAVAQQPLRREHVLAVHGPVQRRAPIVIARLDARAARDQIVDDDRVADLRRIVQRLQTAVVGEVNVGAGLDRDDQRRLGARIGKWVEDRAEKEGAEMGIEMSARDKKQDDENDPKATHEKE